MGNPTQFSPARASELSAQTDGADSGDVYVERTSKHDAADTESTDVWGFADTAFSLQADGSVVLTGDRYPLCGSALPYLMPWVEQKMGITVPRTPYIETTAERSVPPPLTNPGFVAAAKKLLGAAGLDETAAARRRHGHGHTQEEMFAVKYGALARVPDLVVMPESEREVAALVQLAATHNVCLIPYGGGTNVTEALRAPADEARMVVAVSLRRLDRILWIDEVNGLARVEAGAVGRNLVRALAKRGFAIGHEPDSIEFSTLGGWIATNASGMKKNRYGNIEQLVLDVTAVTAHGTVQSTHTGPRQSIGMDVERCFFGSEGALGIITSAIIKIFPLPERVVYGSCLFQTFQDGVAFLYALKREGAEPASVRLVDNTQFQLGQALKTEHLGLAAVKSRAERYFVTRIKGFDPDEMVACTLVFEGSEAEVALQQRRLQAIAKRFGGMMAGEENGRRGYQLTYSIAYIRDFVMQHGILAESFETSLPWSGIVGLCERVRARIQREHKARQLPGRPLVTARVTQVYDTGAAVYFYFAMSFVGVDDPSATYAAIERAAREEILAAGGSLSHHHGVGKLRQPFLAQVMDETALHLRRRIKAAVDPGNVFGVANGPLPA